MSASSAADGALITLRLHLRLHAGADGALITLRLRLRLHAGADCALITLRLRHRSMQEGGLDLELTDCR
jgi:hypothetical protein